MSTSKQPIHPTRQQLDELEALLQRMLALPVNQLDGEASNVSLPALAPIDMPPDWDTGDSAVLSTEAAREARESTALKADGVGDAPRPAAAAQLRNDVRTDRPAAERDPRRWPEADADQNVVAPATNLTIVTQSATGERPWFPAGGRRIPWAWQPLVWGNRAFDRCAGHLGASGRWLRGPRGRAWIGWSGFALLASAAAWAWLEWMGWTW
jgi:hypothetical protein